ncbi:MAG: class I SAM-dependent methyltransferase [Fibrobacter sp.]|nr:class I SAM-dependent methyltransferase [Fibrobacter sp.]
MSKEVYNEDFYKTRHESKIEAAMEICRILTGMTPPVHSAIDFGCGTGTFLYALKELGAKEVLGLDGPWAKNWQVISKDEFSEADFEQPIKLPKKYDLAISLEVAEHISEKHAGQFIESITEASDIVFFSAAVPGQRGEMHVNEQWQSYWCHLFAQKGFICLDYLRPLFWDNEKIGPTLWYYKQNCLLYVKKERVSEIRKPVFDFPVDIVHPDMTKRDTPYAELFKMFLKKFLRKKPA